MAYTGIADDKPEVAQERALASKMQSEAVSSEVQRVNYQGRDVEIGSINHAALGRPVNKEYERNLASVNSRLRAIGVLTATVVNFLPIPLISDSCLHPLKPTYCRVKPPRGSQQRFSTFVFEEAFVEPTQNGIDSPLLANEWHPIQLAGEFSRTNHKGVMTFIGIPSDIDREDWRNRKSTEEQHGGRTYGQVFDQCEADAVAWMQDQLRAGNEDDRLKRNPSEKAKSSARRLHELGLIKEMPAWVEKQRDVTVRIPNCQNCQKPCEPGAAQCTNQNCNYIIDPEKAYKIGAVAEDHPALERLTRDQVKKLGISDYVAETIEEKKDRLAVGGQKPMSAVALRLLEQQDEVAALRARENGEALATAIARLRREEKKDEEKKEKPAKEK